MNPFYKTLTIDERYDCLEKALHTKSLKPELDKAALHSWRTEMTILNNQQFDQILAQKHYQKSLFSMVIKQQPSDKIQALYLEILKQMQWYQIFQQIIENTKSDQQYFEKNTLTLAAPFLIYAKSELVEQLLTNKYLDFIDNQVLNHLMVQLNERLESLANQTINLDSSVTKEEFIHFFQTYVVLARLMTEATILFIEKTFLMCQRLIDNQQQLLTTFPHVYKLYITDIKSSQGDLHNGDAVSKIELNNQQTILYKPKNLQVSSIFAELLGFFNKFSELQHLKFVKGIYKDDYSFEEWIEHKDCLNVEQLQNYYQRFGQLAAIAYLVNGSDFHHENLIAHGQYPILIDIEVIFKHKYALENISEIEKKLIDALSDNILMTGLFPVAKNGKLDYDQSAISGGNTDLKHNFARLNLPLIKNTDMHFCPDYVNQVIAGFQNTCRIIIENKKHIFSILEKFSTHLVRLVFRDTAYYQKIINYALHPTFLQNMLAREKVFENIWGYQISDKAIITYEIQDLLKNDVPIFFNKINTHEIYISTGYTNINLTGKAGSKIVNERLQQLCEADINKQISIIKVALNEYPQKNNVFEKTALDSSLLKLNYQIVMNQIESIADTIIHAAIQTNDEMSWVTINPLNNEQWGLGKIRADFYDGLAGLYLFFQSIYQITEKEKYLDTSLKILNSLKTAPLDNNIGLSGHDARFIHIAARINNQYTTNNELQKLVTQQMTYLENQPLNHLTFDYVNGTFSLINSLIKLYQQQHNGRYLKLACKYADDVINHQQENFLEQIGFAHGNISTALIFYKLYTLTKVKRYQAYADICYQKFSAAYAKIKLNSGQLNNNWCNGNVGILIALNELKQISTLPGIESIITDLNHQLSAQSFMASDCLCHGNLGTIDWYCQLFTLSKNPYHLKQAQELVAKVLVQTQTNKQQFQVRSIDGFEAVSLFTGLAGVGYQLLRVLNPDRFPSVLN